MHMTYKPAMRDLRDHRALVTGASSGIGREMARQLAAAGCSLVVAARRLDRLEELAAELRAAHEVAVDCVEVDLTEPGAPDRLYDAATADGASLDILVNNAGFGRLQRFDRLPAAHNRDMVTVNVAAVVELSQRFLADAVPRPRRSYILNVASTAAFQPVPNFAIYAATKHFVLAFSEALSAELASTRVSVTCLCPGGTWTEFFDTSRQQIKGLAKLSMLPADRVARIGLGAMLKGRRSVVSGAMNKLAAWFIRFVPRSTAGWIAARLVGAPPPSQLGAAKE
jgi:hypothetical protein